MGILIAIDGVDASGKETQSQLLKERLEKENIPVRLVSFPAYDKPSSVLVKEYLNGDYGTNPEDVNAYAASMLFAADRFSTFRKDWKKDYDAGFVIIADRYVTSNLIHQAGKINDKSDKKRFLDWATDLEYSKLGLPKPDITVFLDMPVKYGKILMEGRKNKINGKDEKDIHEKSLDYLTKSYNNAKEISAICGWDEISCVKGGKILSAEDIHEAVYEKVKSILK